jgi:hypothetical protein
LASASFSKLSSAQWSLVFPKTRMKLVISINLYVSVFTKLWNTNPQLNLQHLSIKLLPHQDNRCSLLALIGYWLCTASLMHCWYPRNILHVRRNNLVIFLSLCTHWCRFYLVSFLVRVICVICKNCKKIWNLIARTYLCLFLTAKLVNEFPIIVWYWVSALIVLWWV